MAEIDLLIDQLEKSGQDVFWQGGASDESIDKLESLLSSKLPQSFRAFLASRGGGGVVEEEICGIEDDDPSLQHRGTVYGDTLTCRNQFDLPPYLVVIYFKEELDVVWCLNVSDYDGADCPVVSYDVFSKTKERLAKTFDEFLVEYLTLRISRQ